jgi:hypothetical protein
LISDNSHKRRPDRVASAKFLLKSVILFWKMKEFPAIEHPSGGIDDNNVHKKYLAQ